MLKTIYTKGIFFLLFLMLFLPRTDFSQVERSFIHQQQEYIQSTQVKTSQTIMDEADRHIENSEIDSAVNKYLLVLSNYAPDSMQRRDIYSRLARLYELKENFELAITMHLNAVNFITDSITLMSELASICNVYIRLGDYEKAKSTLKNAIIFFERKQMPFQVVMAMGRIALIYSNLDQHHKSIETGKAAINYLISTQVKTKKASNLELVKSAILNNIADSYLQLDNPDSAFSYLERARESFYILPEHAKAGILISYGEYYTQKQDFAKAMHQFQEGLSIAERLNLLHEKKVGYRELSKLYEQKGNPQLSLLYLKKYLAIHDEIRAKENINRINHLQHQYDLEKKDRQIAESELLLVQQNSKLTGRKQQLYLLLLFSASMIILSVMTYRNMANKQKVLREKVKNTENEKNILRIASELEGEKKERTRLARELHDSVVSDLLVLRLKLNSLYRQNQDHQLSIPIKQAVSEMETISENLRRSTHNMMPVGLKETGLVETLRSFITKLEHSYTRFHFQSFGTIYRLPESTEKLIIMITNELVQNILKHANAAEAIVQINYYEDNISITIEDNGMGIRNKGLQNENGMGLKNVSKNVAILNGTIDIESSESTGTTVFIEIPANH